MKKHFRITNVKSIIMVMMLTISVVVTAANALTSYLEYGKSYNETLEHYLKGLTTSSRDIVETLYEKYSDNIPDNEWKKYFSDIKVEELPSSSVYVVDVKTTNMLYHKTAEKIGQPVSNEVILGLCNDINAGKNFEKDAYVEYKFDGEKKIAAYSVAVSDKYVIVISADKKDITSCVNIIIVKSVAFSLISMFIILGAAVFISTKVMKQLDEVTEVVQQLGRLELNGNDEKVEELCNRKSEIGDIAKAVRDLRDTLRSTVANLKDNSTKLASYSKELSNHSANVSESMGNIDGACTDIAEGATSQADSTEEAIVATSKMGTLIDSSIAAVDELKVVSNEMKEATDIASDKLSEVGESNKKVIDVTQKIKVSISETSESAESIHQAANVITDIASQTTLLALNASIEAARAGEAGRGFSVVASEISQLAEQSNQAAVEIQEIINNLIDNSNQSVEDIQDAKSIIEEQTEHLKDVIDRFEVAKDGIERSLKEIENVKDSTFELDSSKNRMIDIIQGLSAISQQNAASTEETSAAVTQTKTVIEGVSERAAEVSNVASILEEDANKWKL
ncbi:MAG: methyl-accepting chemotaxis protein [Lachnospiraceae bacterium]|nr:methyl-accepting chemotaxis protein [Lachnospiraceae bacterium]